VPKAIRVLEEHLDSGRADAWRPALRVLEHQWGRPPEQITSEPVLEDGELDFEKMSTSQLAAFVREHRASGYAATESESADDSPAVSSSAAS
jgi:hypothetical protein